MSTVTVVASDGIFNLVAGEDVTIPVQVFKSNGAAFDLTGNTEITAKFGNADGSVLTVLKSTGAIVITSATAGQMSISLTDTQTGLMKTDATNKQSFDVWMDAGTTRRIAQFTKKLIVVAKNFT